jgi:hypothetical protein
MSGEIAMRRPIRSDTTLYREEMLKQMNLHDLLFYIT